jgi:protein-tyrosine-phosphatase
MNRVGAGKFVAYSAGSCPRGEVHPQTISLLDGLGYDTSRLRSKSWDEFAVPGAPELDFILTVCDDAAGETCPVWPGHPAQAHWGIPDPAAASDSIAETSLAFADTYRMLNNRIGLFAALPIESLDRISIKRHMDEIGQTRDHPARA